MGKGATELALNEVETGDARNRFFLQQKITPKAASGRKKQRSMHIGLGCEEPSRLCFLWFSEFVVSGGSRSIRGARS